MAMSPYLQQLRERVGAACLLLPSVSGLLFDTEGRLLLVWQRAEQVWSTPGGMIEPDERPAEAVVREMREETGLQVRPQHVAAVFGGPDFRVRYPHGDEVQYTILAFTCTLVGGTPKPDGEEVTRLAYWSLDEALAQPLASWLRPVLPRLFARSTATLFDPPQPG